MCYLATSPSVLALWGCLLLRWEVAILEEVKLGDIEPLRRSMVFVLKEQELCPPSILKRN